MDVQGCSRFVTEREISKLTSFSLSTLRNWRNTGEGPPYYKIQGFAVRYNVEDVLRWVNAQRVGCDPTDSACTAKIGG